MVARWTIFLGSNLTGCSFLIHFFLGGGGGGWESDFISLFMSYFFLFIYFYPFNMYRAHI